MLSAKEAARVAAEYLEDIKNIYDVSLEEIEFSRTENLWLVTLSYTPSSLLGADKEYKIFKVDADDGEVLSMKLLR